MPSTLAHKNDATEEAQSSDSEKDYGTTTDGHSARSTINSFPSDPDVPEDELPVQTDEGVSAPPIQRRSEKNVAPPPIRDKGGRLVVPTSNRRKDGKKVMKSAIREPKSDVQVLTNMLMSKIEATGSETEARLNEMQENMRRWFLWKKRGESDSHLKTTREKMRKIRYRKS